MKTTEQLLKNNGYQILGKKLKEKVVLKINDKDHFSLLEIPFSVRKLGKEWGVVEIARETKLDPSEPEIRRQIIEADRFFGLSGIVLVNPQKEELQEITLKFPREKGLDYYFQFIVALFIIALVVGIIWLMVQMHLF